MGSGHLDAPGLKAKVMGSQPLTIHPVPQRFMQTVGPVTHNLG